MNTRQGQDELVSTYSLTLNVLCSEQAGKKRQHKQTLALSFLDTFITCLSSSGHPNNPCGTEKADIFTSEITEQWWRKLNNSIYFYSNDYIHQTSLKFMKALHFDWNLNYYWENPNIIQTLTTGILFPPFKHSNTFCSHCYHVNQ